MLAIGVASDILYPRYQSQAIVELARGAGLEARYVELDSPHGHDAFLIEFDQVGDAAQRVPRRPWSTDMPDRPDRPRTSRRPRSPPAAAPAATRSRRCCSRRTHLRGRDASTTTPHGRRHARTTQLYSPLRQPDRPRVRGRRRRARGRRGGAGVRVGHGRRVTASCSACARRATTSSPRGSSSRSPTRCSPCTCPASASTSRSSTAPTPTPSPPPSIPGRTQLVFVETPANPALSLVDLDAVGAIKGPIKVVDSTFAGPAVQRPLEHGVDLVLHSATKGIAGHNDALLGVIAGERGPDRRGLGAATRCWARQASPFDAWNGIRGIRTLPARVRQQSRDGAAAGRVPRGAPAVESVSYPGLEPPAARPGQAPDGDRRRGGHLRGRRRRRGAASASCERCRLARLALSLGGPETLVTHPATIAGRYTPAERAELGITDGLVRMSVGLEHADDLEADLAQALDG